jgi:glyoxylase-like metal-dependent hydrolase (beta-lactamase superfamily II)
VEVAKGIHVVSGPVDGVPIDVHLVLGKRIALIDSGVAQTPRETIAPYLASIGLELSDIDLILHTHGHHDHVGGDAEIARHNPMLRIAAHALDAPWIEDRERYYAELFLDNVDEWRPPGKHYDVTLAYAGAGTRVDFHVRDGDRVPVGAGRDLDVTGTPSHSPGHVAYLQAETGVVIAGDAIQAEGVATERHGRVFPLYHDVRLYRDTLACLSSLRADLVLTSHLGILTEQGARDLIARSASFVDELDDRVTRLLKRACEPMRLRTVVAAVAAEYPEYQAGLQLVTTTDAHLRDLVERAAAETVEIDGVLHWHIGE